MVLELQATCGHDIEQWKRDDAKTPVPRTGEDRALYSRVLGVRRPRRSATTWGFLGPCRHIAPTSSSLSIVSSGLPGRFPVDPDAIRTRDGPPCLQPYAPPSGIRRGSGLPEPIESLPPVCTGGTTADRGNLADPASPPARPELTAPGETRGHGVQRGPPALVASPHVRDGVAQATS